MVGVDVPRDAVDSLVIDVAERVRQEDDFRPGGYPLDDGFEGRGGTLETLDVNGDDAETVVECYGDHPVDVYCGHYYFGVGGRREGGQKGVKEAPDGKTGDDVSAVNVVPAVVDVAVGGRIVITVIVIVIVIVGRGGRHFAHLVKVYFVEVSLRLFPGRSVPNGRFDRGNGVE